MTEEARMGTRWLGRALSAVSVVIATVAGIVLDRLLPLTREC
jgi:hypothetical protein